MRAQFINENIRFERGSDDILRTLRIGKNKNNPILDFSSYPLSVRENDPIYTDPNLDKEIKEKSAALLGTTPDKLRIPISVWDEVAGEEIFEPLDFYPDEIEEYEWDYINNPDIEEIWSDSKFLEADIVMESDPNYFLQLSFDGLVFIVRKNYGPVGVFGTIY